MTQRPARCDPGGGAEKCVSEAGSGSPLIIAGDAAAQVSRLDFDELALLANWKDAVLARIHDAQDRFETTGLHPVEEANLIAEVVAFKEACGRARQ